MEADDGLEIRTGSRKLERGRATEAIADCSKPSGVGLRLARQHTKRSRGDVANALRVGHEGLNTAHCLLQFQHLAAAMVIHAVGDVAETGQLAPERFAEVAKPGPLMCQQHAWPLSGACFVDREVAEVTRAAHCIFDVDYLQGNLRHLLFLISNHALTRAVGCVQIAIGCSKPRRVCSGCGSSARNSGPVLAPSAVPFVTGWCVSMSAL